MNESAGEGARAALVVARAAFESMTAASDPRGVLAASVSLPAEGDGDAPPTMAVRVLRAWLSAEGVLRAATGRSDLSGQPLVGEARRQERLSLTDAHALVGLLAWVERAQIPGAAAQTLSLAPTEAEQGVAATALAALEHVVASLGGVPGSVPEAQLPFTAVEAPRAGPGGPPPLPTPSPPAPTRKDPSGGWSPPPIPPPLPPKVSPRRYSDSDVVAPRGSSSRSSAVILSIVVLVLFGAGGGAWYWFTLRSSGDASYTEGVAAYTRGAREAARIAFAKAAQENPDDARPLIFLGRIAREEGDVARGRRFLESAVRLAPENALALRELASAMLADGQPEIARRFYVRSLSISPNDRTAQGFLGCSLIRLQRVDEGQRWLNRAGSGEWLSCASIAVPPNVMAPPLVPITPPPR